MRVRRLLFVMVLAAALCTAAAPEAGAGTREAIVWGGAAVSDVFGSDGESLGGNNRSSYTWGLSVYWKLGRHVGVELGGRYTKKGTSGKIDTRYSERDSTSGFILDAELELSYIEVPLLVAGVLPVGERSEVRGYAGASANFLTSSQITGTLNGFHYDAPADNVTDLDWAGVLGLSYEYRMHTVALVFDMRFVASLGSIEDAPDLDADVKLGTFEFAIGLGIPLGADHF